MVVQSVTYIGIKSKTKVKGEKVMDMDQAAVFLSGSILTALGFLVIIGAVVIVNNILHLSLIHI